MHPRLVFDWGTIPYSKEKGYPMFSIEILYGESYALILELSLYLCHCHMNPNTMDPVIVWVTI